MEVKEKVLKKRGKQVSDIIEDLTKVKEDDDVKALEEKLRKLKARKKQKEEKSIIELLSEVNKVSYAKIIKEIFKIIKDPVLIKAIIEMQKEKNRQSVNFLEDIKENILDKKYEMVYQLLGLEYKEPIDEEKDEDTENKENLEEKDDEYTKEESEETSNDDKELNDFLTKEKY